MHILFCLNLNRNNRSPLLHYQVDFNPRIIAAKIIYRQVLSYQLRQDKQLSKSTFIFFKQSVSHNDAFCRSISHSPHQSNVKYKQFEYGHLFIEFQWN